VIKIKISLTSSCLAKERCIPIIAHWKSLDTWPENTDFKHGMWLHFHWCITSR
jgi:hypothetical protein